MNMLRVSGATLKALLLLLLFKSNVHGHYDDDPDNETVDFGPMVCAVNGDETVSCYFTVLPPSPKSFVKSKEIDFRNCPEGSGVCIEVRVVSKLETNDGGVVEPNIDEDARNGEGDDREVHQYKDQHEYQPNNDNDDHDQSYDSGSNRNHDGSDYDRDANQNSNQNDGDEEEPSAIHVNQATYEPPFAQYGHFVSEVLNDSPRSANPFEWASWYGELGSAHFDSATTSEDGEGVDYETDWYKMELALNAFRQAIETMDELRTKNSLNKQECDLFLASMYLRIGEVYSMHPDGSDMPSAMEYFEKSLQLWDALRQATPTTALHDLNDINLNWADVSVRLSSLLMQRSGEIEGDDIVEMIMSEDPTEAHNAEGSRQDLERAERLISGAIRIYENEPKYPTKEQQLDAKMRVFNALQTAATIATMTMSLGLASRRFERVVEIYETDLVRLLEPYSEELDSVRVTVADALLTLADTLLQQGKYDDSQKYYTQAMVWYEEHNIPIPPIYAMNDEEALESYKQALQEYHASLSDSDGGGGNMDGARRQSIYDGTLDEEGGGYYGRDDNYEGDLQAGLGTIYLAQGQIGLAIECFAIAEKLYGTGELDRALADLKLNLAMAYFHGRRFQESANAHQRALEIYRELYGDNINPMMQEMEGFVDHFGAAAAAEDDYHGDIKKHIIDIDEFTQGLQNLTDSSESQPESEADDGNDEL